MCVSTPAVQQAILGNGTGVQQAECQGLGVFEELGGEVQLVLPVPTPAMQGVAQRNAAVVEPARVHVEEFGLGWFWVCGSVFEQ